MWRDMRNVARHTHTYTPPLIKEEIYRRMDVMIVLIGFIHLRGGNAGETDLMINPKALDAPR